MSEQQPHEQNPCQLQGVQQLSQKNLLQEFTQRACLPLPIYHTVNEQRSRGVPEFRTTVEVDGERYGSLNAFPNRKAAEQEAARLALEAIRNKIKNFASKKSTDGKFPPIHEDKVFSKSILHEFAAKTNKKKPTYDTVRLEGVVPVFVSSLDFDGSKYTGGHGMNKKEAEQLAARTAILTILASSEEGTILSEIVKSKAKMFTALQESCNIDSCVSHLPDLLNSIGSASKGIVPQQDGDSKAEMFTALNDNCNVDSNVSHLPNSVNNVGSCAARDIVADDTQKIDYLIENVGSESLQQQPANKKPRVSNNTNEADNVIGHVVPEVLQLPSPIMLREKFGNFPQPSLLLITLLPELPAQTSTDGIASAGGRKNRKKKKKKAKKASTNMQMQASNLPVGQDPPCTMTQ